MLDPYLRILPVVDIRPKPPRPSRRIERNGVVDIVHPSSSSESDYSVDEETRERAEYNRDEVIDFCLLLWELLAFSYANYILTTLKKKDKLPNIDNEDCNDHTRELNAKEAWGCFGLS